MSTPEGSAAPEGAGDSNTNDDDATAQEALSRLAAQEAQGEGSDDGDDNDDDNGDDRWDEARARRRFEAMKRDLEKARGKVKELTPLAAEAEKRRKGEMTESQKLTEEKAALEVELAELRTTNVRREAAEAVGLPSRLVKYINAAEPAEALAQAKELAKEFKVASGESGGGGKTDFRQGARGANNSGSNITQDDILRQMAGRGR